LFYRIWKILDLSGTFERMLDLNVKEKKNLLEEKKKIQARIEGKFLITKTKRLYLESSDLDGLSVKRFDGDAS
jgi:hypothetical protein